MSTFSKLLKLSKTADPDDDTLERLRRTIRQDPRSLQFVPLADLCRKRLLFDEAIAVCQQGLAHHPTYVSGFVALARAFQEVGDGSQAIDAYHRVVELAPDNLVGHLGLGELFEHNGQLELACDHFRAALKLGASGADLEKRVRRLEQHLHPERAPAPPGIIVEAAATGPTEQIDPSFSREKIQALEAWSRGFAALDA